MLTNYVTRILVKYRWIYVRLYDIYNIFAIGSISGTVTEICCSLDYKVFDTIRDLNSWRERESGPMTSKEVVVVVVQAWRRFVLRKYKIS